MRGLQDAGAFRWDRRRAPAVTRCAPGDKQVNRPPCWSQPSFSSHWGYSEAFLEIVRPMLTFTEHDITANPVYVLEGSDGPGGHVSPTRHPATGNP